MARRSASTRLGLGLLAPAVSDPSPASGWSMGGHDYQNSRSNPVQTKRYAFSVNGR